MRWPDYLLTRILFTIYGSQPPAAAATLYTNTQRQQRRSFLKQSHSMNMFTFLFNLNHKRAKNEKGKTMVDPKLCFGIWEATKGNSDLKALASKIGDAPCVLSPPSRQQEEAEWWMF